MMKVYPDQADPKYKHSHSHMTIIEFSIDTLMLKNHHDLLVQLASVDHRKNPYLGTPKKERRGLFSECCTKILKRNS